MFINLTIEIEIKDGLITPKEFEEATNEDTDEFAETIETILKEQMTVDVLDVTVIEISFSEESNIDVESDEPSQDE